MLRIKSKQDVVTERTSANGSKQYQKKKYKITPSTNCNTFMQSARVKTCVWSWFRAMRALWEACSPKKGRQCPDQKSPTTQEKKRSSLLTRCFAELSAHAIAMRAGGIYHIPSLLSSKCLDNSSTSTEKSWEKASVCRTWCMKLLHSWLNHYRSHYSLELFAIKLEGLIWGPLLPLFLTKFLWLFQP